jgi:general stress protein 26
MNMKKLIIDIRKLEKFVSKRKVAFIASMDDEGFPNVKALLSPRKRDGIKTFYFSTNTSSMRVKQYRDNPKSCLYFYRKGLIKYQALMLTGKMEVLEDNAMKQDMWRFGDKMFYSQGVTDPDYCILKFTASKGRYYCDLRTENFDIQS